MRIEVGPVGVVDQQHDGRIPLQVHQRGEDRLPDIGRAPRRHREPAVHRQPIGTGCAQELVDDAERDRQLPWLAVGAQHGRLVELTDELFDE
jgi:hypothetical protein